MSTGLVGPNGKPISSVQFKKATPPKQGEAFAAWAGRDFDVTTMPGGGLVQFDLSKLRLEDFRTMRDHYQVNASLAVLSFMQHQSDWHIECEEKKIAVSAEEQMRSIWTTLNRSMSTANWSGYSPNALNWESDYESGSMMVTKVKDLHPEECEVNWKEVKGWHPPDRPAPKFKVYDGIKYYPQPGWPIPVENSFWYPLLMEHGNYYGRKLLRPAFQSWFFSILVHLFANRYFERFGEPTPIGRAPFEEEIDVDGTPVRGNEYLLSVLERLRNRSVVVLPNDRSPHGKDNQMEFDYEIDYLESQMRGADFERYLTRLDEEISIGLFTPILLLRTADVGSYNLGQGHERIYQVMLNAMNDDRKQYIDKYILRKFVNYNFSERAPSARIVFHKGGNLDKELIREVLVELVKSGKAKFDLEELGQMIGMTIEEIRQTLAQPEPETSNPEPDNAGGDSAGSTGNDNRNTIKEILVRVKPQIENAFSENKFGPDLKVNMGYKRRLERELQASGVKDAAIETNKFYANMDAWLKDVVALGPSEFSNPDAFMSLFERVLNNEMNSIRA